MTKILVMGLPGAGKTTLAAVLAKRLGAVHFNADAVRDNLNKDLKFSVADRIEQARRMGWLADQVVKAGHPAVADFVSPTPETRLAFGVGQKGTFVVWVDRIQQGRFEDTNKLFVPPTPDIVDLRVPAEGSPEYWAEQIVARVRPTFDPKKPTAFVLGRFQPFHEGHQKLVEEALARVGQVYIAVRDTQGTDEKNPFNYEDVRSRVQTALSRYEGRFAIGLLPNVTKILYGRDVGYQIERIDLDQATQEISATGIRQALADGPAGIAPVFQPAAQRPESFDPTI